MLTSVTCGFEIGASCFVENIAPKQVQKKDGTMVELQMDDFDWTVGHSVRGIYTVYDYTRFIPI